MLSIKIDASHEDCQYMEEYCATSRKSIQEFFKECIFLHKRRQNQKFEATELIQPDDFGYETALHEINEEPKEGMTKLVGNSDIKGKRRGKKEISNS